MDTGKRSGPAQYDLHLHTFWSYDATAEIRPYFERARELGMRCLAITEHHNMDSAPEVAEVAKDFPDIQWIPSAELSVTTSIGPVDLLCYNLPLQAEGELATVLDEYNAWQRASGDSISRGMQALGFDFNEEERRKFLATYRPPQTFPRQGVTHMTVGRLREACLKLGYISNEEEFVELNRRRREAVPGPAYPAVEKVVRAVKSAGALVVLAHPTLYIQEKDLRRLDMLSEECGLDGIECAHRRVTPELTEFYRNYCLQHGMVSTAGSDSHHSYALVTPEQWGYTPDHAFASHIGELKWLEEFLERL